jgi:hypothetical protein
MNSALRSWLSQAALYLALSLLAVPTFAQQQHLIVKTKGSRDALRQAIQGLGGQVDIEYQNIPAVAATLPNRALLTLRDIPDFQVLKDLEIHIPQPSHFHGTAVAQIDASSATVVELSKAPGVTSRAPADYVFNNRLIHASALQDQGNLGQGVVVGVIDSGIANNPAQVASLAGSVIGGESFVAGDPVASATSTHNGLHGTWVSNMIAGHAIFFFNSDSCLPLSVKANAPDSVIDGTPFGLPGATGIPIVGVAPAARLYAFKVFPSNSDSTRSSLVIAAMDRALTLKKNFLGGQAVTPVSGTGTEDDPFVFNSLNIQVLNLSLGGPDLFAGRSAEALIDSELLNAGIVVSISTGNSGPSGGTVQSPGDGLAAFAVGSATTATHDRIFNDLLACADKGTRAIGTGALAHPTSFDQVSFFSSRGPTSDGRVGVSAVSAGDDNIAQGADGFLYIISGTSFSAPTGAGAAALLAAAAPNATAKQIRNALVLGANDAVLTNRTATIDRGGGYLDVAASLKKLQDTREARDNVPVNFFTPSVARNLLLVGVIPDFLPPGGTVSHEAHSLQAGDRRDFFVEIPKSVGSITFNITDVDLDSPDKQNALFGDDVIVAVHQAKMTGGTADDYAIPPALVVGPASVTFPNPEPGFLRVTLMADSTNAGRASVKFKLSGTLKPRPDAVFTGTIADQQVQFIPFAVPAGLSQATFELTWDNDWTHYPANDLDLILIDPAGNLDLDGVTLNGRERAVVKNPAAGQWTLAILGSTVFGPAPQGDGSSPTPSGTDRFKAEIFLTP